MRRHITILIFVLLSTVVAQGQIKIGGNVYGGGNSADVLGSTKVTVRSGDLQKVFGGARMANVGGNAYVNIDGKNASGYMVINYVFGGNDIAGSIGTANAVREEMPSDLVDTDLLEATNNGLDKDWKADRRVDDTWNTYVRISSKTKNDGTVSDDNKKIFIGQVYAGGNGDYLYTPASDDTEADYNVTEEGGSDNIATLPYDFTMPHLDKTFLDVQGGSVAFAYGGGNNVTVREKTIIHVDNPSDVVTNILVKEDTHQEADDDAYSEYEANIASGNNTVPKGYIELLSGDRVKHSMGINMTQEHISSADFQIGRFFGGNNKATMAIQPTWNLQRGKIRNLYGGGNEGDMTYPVGLLLDIDPFEKYKDLLVINNVYGGCRKADVHPLNPDGTKPEDYTIQLSSSLVNKDGKGYHFPAGLPARTLVRGGNINNVYGGNDVSGRVYGGNAVGIYTSILGDVYGGGNGSYAYTDNEVLGKQDEYKDFYYDPTTVLNEEGVTGVDINYKSVTALNLFRPNAEQVSLRLWGESAANPTIIGGSVFVGGNSATLKTNKENPMVELKIGSHVYADKVFLGNNGENMVKGELLQTMKDINSITLTNSDQFAQYMDGCTMTITPQVVFDDSSIDPADYIEYTSYFGSFYCGGNVGSIKYTGKNTINFDEKVIIFDKLVGGCNSAFVPASDYNAAFDGGLIGNPDDVTGDKLELNLSGLKLQPKRWAVLRNDSYEKVLDENDQPTYLLTDGTNGDYTKPAPGRHRYLEWNVISAETQKEINPIMPDMVSGDTPVADLDRRLFGGNVYGGCCKSGHVEGNVVVNLNGTIVDREGEYGVFDSATPTDDIDPDILYDHEGYTISTRRSGVILGEQGMDVLGEALTVFGGGKGKGTEIWGSATVNVNKGYCFQVFGGSESGVIGKPTDVTADPDGTYTASPLANSPSTYAFNGKLYSFNPKAPNKYSSYVNLDYNNPDGDSQGKPRDNNNPDDDMADVEFIYGGSFQGPIIGNSIVHLNNGRLFNLFTGSCNADILGHTETYIGENGFPWMRDHIYGGNDLGGKILGVEKFNAKVRDYDNVKSMIHATDLDTDGVPDVLQASSYVEYLQGHTKSVFGGCFGDYDYDTEFTTAKGYSVPYLHNAFVNIRPNGNAANQVEKVFGASEGCPGFRGGDKMQDRSYVLIDIDDDLNNFKTTEVFGSGSNNGMGLRYTKDETLADGFNLDEASAIIDLLRGKIGNVFGGSHNEGVTRRTVVNVPEESTIWLFSEEPDQDVEDDGTKTKHVKEFGNIFGGAYGTQILPPCDVYESNVNYRSDKAIVNGSIFGGNNNERRTLYANVNIYSPVWSSEGKETEGYLSTVYGAGQGKDTWAEHTVVNLYDGAQVYEVYGGGMMGHVLNAESVQKYMQLYKDGPSAQIMADDPTWKQADRWEGDAIKAKYKDDWERDWKDAWTLGDYYTPVDNNNDGYCEYDNYINNAQTNFDRIADRPELDDNTAPLMGDKKKFNTNVIINEGAYVGNYAYGGGYGKKKDALSGDIYGTTYIGLLGGVVEKDIYAAGTAGGVYDLFGSKDFTASANAYIKGGTVRNVYGGGWEGSVGKHTGAINDSPAEDIPGVTHVVIGHTAGTSFTDGIPAIQRNAYGGGEGGAVFGTAHLTLNNGYIGYQYDDSKNDDTETAGINEQYVEKIEDETYLDNNNVFIPNERLKRAGCLFGGGYVDNSSVDKTEVTLYGGHVRNSVFGGGEIAAIGRGTITKTTSGGKTSYELTGLHRPGKTMVEMLGGHVHHSVYGGGRGYDNLSNHGSLNSDGYVFGQTEVNIHGGEIGTKAELSDSVGNVFGGGDVGFVYSAYENDDGTFGRGVKTGTRYGDNPYLGYYYKHVWENDNDVENQFLHDGDERIFTEDCKVLIEPACKVTGSAVSFTGIRYNKGETVSTEDYQYLKAQDPSRSDIDDNRKVTAESITFDRSYAPGSYVPIAALNTLVKNSTAWNDLDPTGIIIHNAVFAGGNTSITSTSGAGGINTPSVFGNATASIHDVYHSDLITLGTRHTGGLYGDGNLTLVDGYRELNITNYGTDYYSIAKEITNTEYHALPERKRAYYELKYTCQKDCKDKDGTSYKQSRTEDGITTKASTITADELLSLFLIFDENNNPTSSVMDGTVAIMVWDPVKFEWKPNETYWKESGVLPVYAGRLMNSIQRADLCGVYGSRMVMQGAPDRVPKEPDFTNYTINRVREVSLNKKLSVISSDTGEDAMHGNYFGIYNIVNYLGALTSDVDFGHDNGTGEHADVGTGDVRTTDNTNSIYNPEYTGQTFYGWKKSHKTDRLRNNGNSHNKVALASGVYLELTTEKSTGTGLFEKDWGPITGVIELDLINVSTGIGGGFVYAKNIHGIREASGRKNTTLTALNSNAVTHWDYIYNPPEKLENEDLNSETDKKEWETSGNFVHSTQTIIDDCYNVSNRYQGDEGPDGAMPAHYWYIKGSVYVYSQLISANTGMPNAYSEAVDIPLTISAASHGTIKLLDIQPNLYAFYSSPGMELGKGKKVVINDKEYYKNDPISYWDWYLLSKSEKNLFVKETYANCVACTIDDTPYEVGEYVMTDTQFNTFKNQTHTYKDAERNDVLDGDRNPATTDYIFRLSNNLGHDTGYMLTYEVNNPEIWNTWYTPKQGSSRDNKIDTKTYEGKTTAVQGGYDDGPTYSLKSATGEMLGQREYKIGDIISKTVEDAYQDRPSTVSLTNQAQFKPAYMVTEEQTVQETNNGVTVNRHLNPGAIVSQTVIAKLAEGSYDEAYICTSTVKLSDTEFIFRDTKMTESERNTYYDRFKDGTEAEKRIAAEILSKVVPAYYCTEAGSYGGRYYQSNYNYRGLEAFSSMSKTDRDKFDFNYDALDLLIDPDYSNLEGQKYQYDGKNYTTEADVLVTKDEDGNIIGGNKAGYSVTQKVDYTASYTGSSNLTLTNSITVKRGNTSVTTYEIQKDDELSRDDFEALPNEKRHYAPIVVKDDTKHYVVNTPFQIGSTPYAVGNTISRATYASLPESEKKYVTELIFPTSGDDVVYYYCREKYTMGKEVTSVSDVTGATGGISEGSVLPGTIISSTDYAQLPNDQKDFTIHGVSPTETSTLFVSRESDIHNLSQDKIITVIYQYDYEESDASGNITPVSERHVLNIRIQFKNGVPIIEDIDAPYIILPGEFISPIEPNVIFDTNALLEPGWELYETERDAQSHINGVKFNGSDFNPDSDPLYWYQDGWFLSYYISTMETGRCYSNYVPVSVANYHDLKDVMTAKNHHYYIDEAGVKRAPKIYIRDYSKDGENGLDLFKNLYDLSLRNTVASDGDLKNHATLNERVKGGNNLEFFLRTDIDHSAPSGSPVRTWTPIASGENDPCFSGTLHGDGHTISGLAPAEGTTGSLFGKLCGSVYNLGVTGSFTGGGVADTDEGYVESCWVKTSGTPAAGVKAVFGNPTDASAEQTVNCYYPESNNGYTEGKAIRMPDKAFYTGEVAYDLNNFYLYKRYNDNATLGGTTTYKYWKAGEDAPLTGSYASNVALCSSGYIDNKGKGIKYVEDRFADGDFIYDGGSIGGVIPDPGSQDERYFLETVTNAETGVTSSEVHYYPIWPDDYLFFGQKLTYGHTAETHQDVPTAIVKTDKRLSQDDDANRVYRAPAYFRSGVMSVAHFNPNAVFAQTKKGDPNTLAYKNMTAIDFTDYWFGNEVYKSYENYKSYDKGTNAGGWFYPPLLDDDGLTDFLNVDLTQNLLVYTADAGANTTAAEKTATVVGNYLTEPDYAESTDGYRKVAKQSTTDIHGHWVEDGLATRDHLLVDKQDFNAPISYTFDAGKRMWYQRTPENYAGQKTVTDPVSGKETTVTDRSAGWEGISLPFSAELVTTHQKGEITHFYDGSETSKNGTTKIGHEYWLRRLENGSTMTPETGTVLKANFTYPNSTNGSVLFQKAGDNAVTNTFLWDYYYKGVTGGHNQEDKNSDIYQKYYSKKRDYINYPLLTNGTPYLIGLPGTTFYEFDLSGEWEATTTHDTKPAKLNKQTITFASLPGTTIQISDGEMDGNTAKDESQKPYNFKPNYLNSPDLETNKHAFLLNTDGNSYVEDVSATTADVSAFRPYFMAAASSSSREITRSIVFSQASDQDLKPSIQQPGTLEARAAHRMIVVSSTLDYAADVTITNTAGQALATFNLQPGESVETRISLSGVYIVQSTKAKYIRKMAVN